ncbi:MAG: hypothetical protein NT172_17910, partial [Planctomycetota bacterium]|nr:hypothetical protein [Planctomycetota bacterium]
MIDPIGDQMSKAGIDLSARIRRCSRLFAFAVAISQGYGIAGAQDSVGTGVVSRFTSKFSREDSGKKMLRSAGLNQTLGQRIGSTPDDSPIKKVLFQDSPPAAPSLPSGTPGLVSPGPSNIELSLPAAERGFAGGGATEVE